MNSKELSNWPVLRQFASCSSICLWSKTNGKEIDPFNSNTTKMLFTKATRNNLPLLLTADWNVHSAARAAIPWKATVTEISLWLNLSSFLETVQFVNRKQWNMPETKLQYLFFLNVRSLAVEVPVINPLQSEVDDVSVLAVHFPSGLTQPLVARIPHNLPIHVIRVTLHCNLCTFSSHDFWNEISKQEHYLQLQSLSDGEVYFLFLFLLQNIDLSVHCFGDGLFVFFWQHVVKPRDLVRQIVRDIIFRQTMVHKGVHFLLQFRELPAPVNCNLQWAAR